MNGGDKMQFDYRIVSKTIRTLRRKRGLSQEVVSGLAGISRTHLTMIENGSKQPNLETVWKICQALNITMSDLFKIIETETSHTSDIDC